MSRKPIDKQQPSECRQAIWEWVRAYAAKHGPAHTFTINDIPVDLEETSIREYLAALHKGGYLEAISQGKRGTANVYRLIFDCGVDAPRLRKDGVPVTQGQGRLQMWNSMRIIKSFTATDLAFNASTDDHQVSESDANGYCQALHKAGYLRVLAPAQTGPGSSKQATYMLIPARWSGPQPPQIQRTKQVYDPNLRRVVWSRIEGGAE